MFIKCQLCNKEFSIISAAHLRCKHNGMTIAEYRKLFPDAPLTSRASARKEKVRITYVVICPNCNKKKTFEKRSPNATERKYCNQSCATSYLNRKTWADPEVRAKRTRGITKQHNTEEYRKNIGATWTPERRKAAGNRARGNLENTIHKPGSIEKMRKTKRDEEHRELARQQAFERWSGPEFKAWLMEIRQEVIKRPEYHEAQKKGALAGWKDNPERRKAQSERAKALWADPEWAGQQLQKMRTGWRARPTNPELILLTLLDENNYAYVYIGDGSLWVGGKNPDFVWPEQRKLIEMNGSYWHSEDEVEPRIAHFANYDFETLVVWDYELENTEQLLIKLKEFHQGIKLIE